MACFHPVRAFRPPLGSVDRKLIFSPIERSDLEPIKVPCGQCIGCRLERSRQWAVRCVHEASLYERNCFITLTFNNENLPRSGSLNKRDFQLFMKRLRKRFGVSCQRHVHKVADATCTCLRYFHCGEYGEKNRRPHYHACLFNFDFPDRELWSVRSGVKLYVSKALSELWPFGFSTVGDVTFESAAYVARYITKKITGPSADSHYERVDLADGQVYSLLPEYTTMSRRPGIGGPWLEKYMSDVYPHDRVVLRGKLFRPPKYYDSVFELADPAEMEEIKWKRQQAMRLCLEHQTPARLEARERLQYLRFKQLKRGYEEHA